MTYLTKKKNAHLPYQERNRLLKSFLWFLIGASFSFLLANADLVINPQISNSIAYIKQFFITSDGTSNGSVGVVLQSSGVFATQYCDLSGANCSTSSGLVSMATQLAGLSSLYLTGGQVDAKITTFSGSLMTYLSGMYYDKTGISLQLAGLSSLYLTGGQVDTKITTFSGSLMTYLSGMYYDKTGISLQLAGLSSLYLTGGQVNSLAKTLTLNNCTNGQVPQYNTGTNAWVCANLSQGGLSQELDPLWLVASGNYYTKVQSDARYITGTTSDKNKWNSAYDWGDHRTQGYITESQFRSLESDPSFVQWLNANPLSSYIQEELDPKVGTLISTKWCTSNGSQISCTSDAPSGGGTSSEPLWLAASGNYYTKVQSDARYITGTTSDKNNWNTAYGWGDHRDKGYLTGGQVNGLAKTLSLSCNENQIPKFVAGVWTCRSDDIGGGADLSLYATISYVSTNYATIGALNNKIDLSQTGNWNTAYLRGNHANEGYVKSSVDPYFTSNVHIASTLYVTGESKLYGGIVVDNGGIYTSGIGHFFAGIRTQGAVGIGTITPNTKLQIIDVGGEQFHVGSTGNAYLYMGYDQNNTYASIGVYNAQSTPSFQDLALNPGGGNVGIGTPTPSQKLEVNGVGKFLTSIYTPQICDLNGSTCITLSQIAGLMSTATPGQMPLKSGTSLDLYDQNTCSGANMGTIRFNSTNLQFEGCNGTQWMAFTGSLMPIVYSDSCGTQHGKTIAVGSSLTTSSIGLCRGGSLNLFVSASSSNQYVYSWSCGNVECSAYQSVNGVCDTSQDLGCLEGDSQPIACNGTTNSWLCAGYNGGNNSSTCYRSNSFMCGGSCFVAGTKITLSDGSYKNIENIQIGDSVIGMSKYVNTVQDFYKKPYSRRLYSMNGSDYFVTDNHLFMTTEGWKSFAPDISMKDYPGLSVSRIELGDVMITEQGPKVLLSIDSQPSSGYVYTFKTSGNYTYFADGFLVHNSSAAQ